MNSRIDDILLNLKEFPVVNENILMGELIQKLGEYNVGYACVVDENTKLKGFITDGDIRRIITNKQLLHFFLNMQTSLKKMSG